MTRVTDFQLLDEAGERALCDAYGNNVAFKCMKCGHPMLAIILPKQNRRGSTPENPAVCRHCGFKAWVVAEPSRKMMRVQSTD
jgi:DNA-directed RNA polymerase subunit RPC12/RpoP